jgi:hypothetical protein
MNRAVAVIPLIIFSLLMAIWAGWLRIGWSIPLTGAAGMHGCLMVNSFLASLIFLERAVTFKSKWWLALPVVHASSALAFATQFTSLGYLLVTLGSMGFLVLCGYFIYRYQELYYYVFFAGAFCLLMGNGILYGKHDYPAAAPWWMGFLLFTIVAERLELSRFLSLTSLKKGLLVCFLATVLAGLIWPAETGAVIFAAAMALTALWLLKYDMARHSIRISGQHRYSGLLLITGYLWLLVTAALMVVKDKFVFGYDAVLHSFFIGFVFSMIFSHAPIILPAVARLPVKIYRPVLYVWFGLMQLSLIMRMAGDAGGNIYWRKMGGLLNGCAMLLFFVSIAVIVRMSLQKRERVLVKA